MKKIIIKMNTFEETLHDQSLIDKQDFMTVSTISENDKKHYSRRECHTNAMKLALKLRKLNPTVVVGYRNKILPFEKNHQRPHFVVIVKDKVWEITTGINLDIAYMISDKTKWFDFTGFEIKAEYYDPNFWLWYLFESSSQKKKI
jgi:putative sterol carrier protein